MTSLCVYTTANDSYVPKSVASLLTIRQHNKSLPLFILGTSFGRYSEKLCRRHGIELIEIDLRSIFYKTWDYPVETYYIFAGPRVFSKRGFTHSIYMDGDIYCNNDPMIDLASVTMFGGITVHKTADIFGKDLNTIHEHFDITNPQQNRMNNGVVYYNNKKLSDIGFLDTMGKLFDRSVKLDIPRKGDDSLYSLFQFTHPNYDYHFLPREYNYYPTENIIPEDRDKYSKKDSDLADNCVFYHFGAKSPKPWVLGAKTPDNITDYFINKWRQSLMVNLSAKEMKRCFPDITNQLRKSTPLPRLLNL